MYGAQHFPGAPASVHGIRRQAGVFGVPTELMVDIDEMPLCTAKAKRQYGHGPIGVPIKRAGQYSRGRKSLNLLLAVDINRGPLTWWIYPGQTTAEVREGKGSSSITDLIGQQP